MSKKDISELLKTILTHHKLGECEILQIMDRKTAKAKVRICETNEVKTFVLSPQFFSNLEAYNITTIVKTPVKKSTHIHRKVDLEKYRNHPLVKQLDKRERTRATFVVNNVHSVDDDIDDIDKIVI